MRFRDFARSRANAGSHEPLFPTIFKRLALPECRTSRRKLAILGRGSIGHLWQGRFKEFPCRDDAQLLTVLRDVERNALRAGLVDKAEDWKFGSLYAGLNGSGKIELDSSLRPRDAVGNSRVNLRLP